MERTELEAQKPSHFRFAFLYFKSDFSLIFFPYAQSELLKLLCLEINTWKQ